MAAVCVQDCGMSHRLPRYVQVTGLLLPKKVRNIIEEGEARPIVGWQEAANYPSSKRKLREKIRADLRGWVIERDGAECYLCGKQCDETEIHIDHVHPVSKGGDNHPLNLRVTCAPCNLKKSNHTLDSPPSVPIRGVTERVIRTSNALNSMHDTEPLGALLRKERANAHKHRRSR